MKGLHLTRDALGRFALPQDPRHIFKHLNRAVVSLHRASNLPSVTAATREFIKTRQLQIENLISEIGGVK